MRIFFFQTVLSSYIRNVFPQHEFSDVDASGMPSAFLSDVNPSAVSKG